MKAKLKKKSREEIVDPHTAIYHFKIYLLNIGESLKFGANFLYYWTYRQKNGFKTE